MSTIFVFVECWTDRLADIVPSRRTGLIYGSSLIKSHLKRVYEMLGHLGDDILLLSQR
ncbi:hypothetical protein PILCRDRAFT_812537 [Piloderma croceum F 1598]|uniref:Uncharacterized protein n=1 Tax=Piloderma croceum (strain F 1598) TaxID=765440 RepID=A0A0C3GGH7_PILCF|nr:hypothetical protein PILCRDRAFT_812537 [Piloderma croceum F 1598]